MGYGVLGIMELYAVFLYGLLSISLIDVVLVKSNAVAVAMAVRFVPEKQRKKTIIYGVGAAILMKVALILLISHLLRTYFIQFLGGMLML
jgi:predicted tellurium resistance membrane protein TerC